MTRLPELLKENDAAPVWRDYEKQYYADSFLSLILVGILCYVMTWAQGRLFKDENERAKKEVCFRTSFFG